MNQKNKPRGTQDIFFPRSLLYQKTRQIIEEVLRKNNYQPVIFPTYEYAELFQTSLGSTTDIIHKEMFKFQDRKGRNLVLRPEGTASAVRLVCENKLATAGYPLKLYYWANMFRYERPQKGRYREFWQLGVELINARGIYADWQILQLIHNVFQNLGIENFELKLNYLGDNNTKIRYKKKLEKFIQQTTPDLCVDCHKRYLTNSLRILDCSLCKDKFSFPTYQEAWDKNDKNYLQELNQLLNKFAFPYHYDNYLVRGLDYYTGLVFEVDCGEQKSLLGGGRYDKLYQEIGNIDLPALGFAIGLDRLMDYCERNSLLKIDNKIDIFFFVSDPTFYPDILTWKTELEKYPLVVEYNLEIKKIKTLGRVIDYYQPRLIILLGEKELKSGNIFIKDCHKGQNFQTKKAEIIEWIYDYLINN